MLILLASLAVLLILGIPIAYAIGLSSILFFALNHPDLVQILPQRMFAGFNSYTLIALPLFILMGFLMNEAGITAKLINFCQLFVGRFRGGLGLVNVGASMIFGGISGSSAADTSSIGSILIPMMKKDGYDADFATTVTMASSVQGILIPPSHNMIIFALVAGSVSIGRLFLAGMIPGILLGIALMIYSYFVSVKRNYPKSDRFRLGEALRSFADAGLGLGTVIIVVVGVVAGVFTATESAAIAVIYAFVITFFVYKEIPLRAVNGILTRSLKTLSVVMILVSTASAFGWLVAYLTSGALVDEVGGFLEETFG